jgi:hypothetical protein
MSFEMESIESLGSYAGFEIESQNVGVLLVYDIVKNAYNLTATSF